MKFPNDMEVTITVGQPILRKWRQKSEGITFYPLQYGTSLILIPPKLMIYIICILQQQFDSEKNQFIYIYIHTCMSADPGRQQGGARQGIEVVRCSQQQPQQQQHHHHQQYWLAAS